MREMAQTRKLRCHGVRLRGRADRDRDVMSCLLARRESENIHCVLMGAVGTGSNSRSRTRLAALSLESADSLFVPLLSHWDC